MGVHSTFNQETADIICERIARGESLRAVCSDEGMPAKSTVLKWIKDREDFQNQYARAREDQADFYFDQIIEIADETSKDYQITEDGIQPNQEVINRSRLRIDARKWIVSKLRPKKYGDKIDVTSDGEKVQSFNVVVSSIEAAEALKKIN